MDISQFHRALLGKDQDQTPAHWRLREDFVRLYEAFNASGKCGYDSEAADPLKIVAIFVLALSQTKAGQLSVMIFTPHNRQAFVKEWLRAMATHCFRARRGSPKDQVLVVREAFNRILLSSDYVGQPFPSGPWVAFGLTKTDPSVPNWIKESLL